MIVENISEANEKQRIARLILEALPEWFGIPEAREQYIQESANQAFYAAYNEDQPIGFICLKETGKDTLELHVMGVLKKYHRKGVGKNLFEKARETAARNGYSFLQVKTVQMGGNDDYDNITIIPINSIFRWVLKSLKYSLHCGMRVIRVRYM